MVARPTRVSSLRASLRLEQLRGARACYDYLAGFGATGRSLAGRRSPRAPRSHAGQRPEALVNIVGNHCVIVVKRGETAFLLDWLRERTYQFDGV
jgi:hypothetical protein